MKLLPYIVFKKHINILALEMTSPGNRHCDNCINALSFSIRVVVMVDVRISYGWGEASTDKKTRKKDAGAHVVYTANRGAILLGIESAPLSEALA